MSKADRRITGGIMRTATRLIFGMRASGSVSLLVTASGQLPAQPPDLVITASGRKEIVVPWNDDAWTVTLDSGDYVVRMPAPGSSWFLGAVTFTLGAPTTIVVPGATASSPLVTWTATTGTASDPKNPWPPPLAGKLDSEPIADPVWLSGALTTLSAQVAVDRSEASHDRPARTAKQDRFG